MTDAACFAEEDDGYQSLRLARSYWSDSALGGRAVVGLLGAETADIIALYVRRRQIEGCVTRGLLGWTAFYEESQR